LAEAQSMVSAARGIHDVRRINYYYCSLTNKRSSPTKRNTWSASHMHANLGIFLMDYCRPRRRRGNVLAC
jgi:hypothetical protein